MQITLINENNVEPLYVEEHSNERNVPTYFGAVKRAIVEDVKFSHCSIFSISTINGARREVTTQALTASCLPTLNLAY